MRIIGLTGSIATGKTTAAGMLRRGGVPVFDSDAAVHGLYGGAFASTIERAFPGVVSEGRVDRALLASRVVDDPVALETLERLVHPRVTELQAAFLSVHRDAGRHCAVLDVPLLFETGGDTRVDMVLVVTVSAAVQKERAMRRPGMTEERLNRLLSRQMPDREKRHRAHMVIDTGHGLSRMTRDIAALLRVVALMR